MLIRAIGEMSKSTSIRIDRPLVSDKREATIEDRLAAFLDHVGIVGEEEIDSGIDIKPVLALADLIGETIGGEKAARSEQAAWHADAFRLATFCC